MYFIIKNNFILLNYVYLTLFNLNMCAVPFLMTTERCHATCFLFTCFFFPKSLHLGSVRMCCFQMSPQWAIHPRLYSSQIQLDSLLLLWVLSQSWSPNISLPKVPLYHRLSVTWLHSIRADDGSRAQDSSLHWGRVYLIKASSIELLSVGFGYSDH